MSRIFEMLRQAQRDQELLKRASQPAVSNSRNFHVLHQAGKDQQLFESPAPSVAAPPQLAPPPAGIFRGETFKLVQQLFLTTGSPAPRSVAFCAVEPGNERDWICARAAELLASHTKASICIVDANVANPSLHTYFGVENGRGLATAMIEPGPVKNFTRRVSKGRLRLLSAGVPPPGADANRALASERLGARMAELRASFDHVLVDAPPATGNSVAAYLGSLTYGVILIVEPSFTPRQAARELKEEIEASGGHVLGVVLHRRALPFSDRIDSRRQNQTRGQNR
jgi:Mrp family chromosome partitioning ATPase